MENYVCRNQGLEIKFNEMHAGKEDKKENMIKDYKY